VQTSVLLKRHGSDIADVEKDFAEVVLENTKDNFIPIVVPRFGPFGECAQLGKTICESRQLEHTTVDLCCHSYLVCTTASSQNRFSICLQFRLRYGRSRVAEKEKGISRDFNMSPVNVPAHTCGDDSFWLTLVSSYC
jgi:hypothetical protein